MAKFLKYLFFLSAVALSGVEVCAQQTKIDSLLNILKTSKEDTNKVNVLYFLSEICDEADILKYCEPALKLAENLNYQKGVANISNNIGNVFYLRGNIPKALEFYTKSLKIREELNDERGMAETLINLGIIYQQLGNPTKAQENFKKSLSIRKKMNDKPGISMSLHTFGVLSMQQGNMTEAFGYFNECLIISEETNNIKGVAESLNKLGSIYLHDKEFTKAIVNFDKALKLFEKENDIRGIAFCLNNLGACYANLKKYSDAEKFALQSLNTAKQAGLPENIRNAAELLKEIYDVTGRYNQALEMMKLFVQMRDSITNDENTKKTIQTQMQYEFDKQQTTDSITNAEKIKQEELKHEQEIQQQKIYSYGGAIGFLLMIIVAGVSFRAYKTKQKANEIISVQKQLVEEKQKEILDSIHYAKRIQQSLLPTEKYIEKSLTRLKRNK